MFDSLEHKFDTLEHKFETLEHKFGSLEHKFDTLEHRFLQTKQGGRIKMRSPPKVLTGNFRPSQLSFFLS